MTKGRDEVTEALAAIAARMKVLEVKVGDNPIGLQSASVTYDGAQGLTLTYGLATVQQAEAFFQTFREWADTAHDGYTEQAAQ